jgi:hypothetical protein
MKRGAICPDAGGFSLFWLSIANLHLSPNKGSVDKEQ